MKSLEANKQVPYHKYMQLGTVRPDGRPSVRTVVFRGFHQDTDQITFATDTRHARGAPASPSTRHNFQSNTHTSDMLYGRQQQGSGVPPCAWRRTYKVEHVQKEPWAEICWYFTESREQFRLGGNLQIIGEDHPDEKLQKVAPPDYVATHGSASSGPHAVIASEEGLVLLRSTYPGV